MITEEEKENREGRKIKNKEDYQNKRSTTQDFKEEKPEWERKIVKEDEKSKGFNYITIWDLPADINKREIEYMCKRFKKANIVRIKRSKYKALAIIQTEELREESLPWSIPVGNNKLVKVTKEEEDYEMRDKQRQHIAKLTELPENASEVLLL